VLWCTRIIASYSHLPTWINRHHHTLIYAAVQPAFDMAVVADAVDTVGTFNPVQRPGGRCWQSQPPACLPACCRLPLCDVTNRGQLLAATKHHGCSLAAGGAQASSSILKTASAAHHCHNLLLVLAAPGSPSSCSCHHLIRFSTSPASLWLLLGHAKAVLLRASSDPCQHVVLHPMPVALCCTTATAATMLQ
jgi:hypothetical protein